MQKRSSAFVPLETESYELPADFPLTIIPYSFDHRYIPWMHVHNVLEIGVCAEGEGVFTINDQEYPFGPGDVFVIRPREFHHAHSPEGKACRWHFIFVDTVRLAARVFFENVTLGAMDWEAGSFSHRVRRETHPILCGAVEALLDEFEKERSWRREGLLVAALKVLIELARSFPAGSRNTKGRQLTAFANAQGISPALRLIAERFAEPLPLSALARACRMSVPHFRRQFRAVMQRAPGDYLQAYRVAQAARVLADTDKTVAEVAYAHGFQSISAFNRQFATRLGMTPTVWRRR